MEQDDLIEEYYTHNFRCIYCNKRLTPHIHDKPFHKSCYLNSDDYQKDKDQELKQKLLNEERERTYKEKLEKIKKQRQIKQFLKRNKLILYI